MLINDRSEARNHFYNVWQKMQQRLPLQPMEAIIADVIALHPEYHQYLEEPEASIDEDFKPELGNTNPFLHMGMHIALKEQQSTDRPAGVVTIYSKLLKKLGNPHDVEHSMMECLGETLWLANRDNKLPDEQYYLQCLQRLL